MLTSLACFFFFIAERIPFLRRVEVPALHRFVPLDLLYFLQSRLLVLIAVIPVMNFVSDRVTAVADNPPLGAVAAVFLLSELTIYLAHRAIHAIPFTRRVHAVHHGIQNLDALSSFRLHVVENVFYLLHFLAFVFVFNLWLGWPTVTVLAPFGARAIWQIFTHANLRLDHDHVLVRPLEWALHLPRSHRLHHTYAHAEKNFGVVLTLWDRVFGTYESPRAPGNAELALSAELGVPDGFLAQQAHPFRRHQ